LAHFGVSPGAAGMNEFFSPRFAKEPTERDMMRKEDSPILKRKHI
jgi:hypothetical protein